MISFSSVIIPCVLPTITSVASPINNPFSKGIKIIRISKDRTANEVSQSEIRTISYDSRKKFIAVGAFEEPVLIYRYPY